MDYKKGSARRTSEGEREAREPESIQVGAYALLLQEQGVKVSGAVIYYAAYKKRVPVEIGEELLAKTRQAITDAKALAASGHCPPPLKNDARCLGCSAYPICLPNESHWWAKAKKAQSWTTSFILVSLVSPCPTRMRCASGFSKR